MVTLGSAPSNRNPSWTKLSATETDVIAKNRIQASLDRLTAGQSKAQPVAQTLLRLFAITRSVDRVVTYNRRICRLVCDADWPILPAVVFVVSSGDGGSTWAK